MRLTLWGEKAEAYPGDVGANPIVAVKGIKVSEYNGAKQIQCSRNAIVEYNPDLVEGRQLHEWWQNEGSAGQFVGVSGGVSGHLISSVFSCLPLSHSNMHPLSYRHLALDLERGGDLKIGKPYLRLKMRIWDLMKSLTGWR